MKEEWKVYIKGVPERGKEVIKTLTDLGAENLSKYVGSDLGRIYYIGHDGNIHLLPLNTELTQVIIDNYQEIKLPEWKDGDILIRKDGTYYKVFSDYDLSHITIFYAYNVPVSIKDGKITPYESGVWVCDRKDYRLATSEEIEQFHNILHKKHKEWDVEKKQLVDWRWKPKENDIYYYVDGCMIVEDTTFEGRVFDEGHYEVGNCFRTYEEAEAMAEKIKKLLKGEEL